MKRLNTIEEIKELSTKKLITTYSNFQQLANIKTEQEVLEELKNERPFYADVIIFNFESFIGENAMRKIYELGGGYYMVSKREYISDRDFKKVYEGEIICIYKIVE